MNTGNSIDAAAPLSMRQRALRSIHKRGLLATFGLGVSFVRERLRRNLTWNPFNPVRQYIDRRYDARYGVDTAGIDWLHDVDTDSANAYSPVPRSTLLRLLRRIHVDYREFVFIDIGCGKGKALLVAAELPFKKVLGVELAPRLVEVARENLRILSARRKIAASEVFAGDAREFSFPREPLIVFFYDPFSAAIMQAVVHNLATCLQFAPRPVYIIYLDPSHRHILDACDSLTLVNERSGCCIYSTVNRA